MPTRGNRPVTSIPNGRSSRRPARRAGNAFVPGETRGRGTLGARAQGGIGGASGGRRAASLAALVATALIVAVVLAELVVRVRAPIPDADLLPLAYNRAELDRIIAGGTYYRFDQTLGWTVGVHASGGIAKATYRSNEAGLRADREYAPEASPGARRIAAFGDSFTHCDEVSYQNCWTARLEASLPNSEVLNFGVPGYGPDQAWLRYQRDGKPFHPCAVLIDYFVENINRAVNRFRPFYAVEDGIVLSKPRFQLDGGALRLLPNPTTAPEQLENPWWVEEHLGPGDAWYFPGVFTSTPWDLLQMWRIARSAAYRQTRRAMERGDARYPLYQIDPEAVTLVERIITEFAREVERDGATPVVVFFPGRRDETDYAVRDIKEPYASLEASLRGAGLATVDLAEVVRPVVVRSGTEGLYAENGHYSARGNGLISDALREKLPGLIARTCRG